MCERRRMGAVAGWRTLGRVAAAVFAVLTVDVAAGVLLGHVRPIESGERERNYRIASPVYHHDLRPSTTTTTTWGTRRAGGRWTVRQYVVTTDSLGFKDREARVVAPRGSSTRVLFLGDSFTEGIGVEYDDTFVGRIGRALGGDGVEVLNAAVASYAPSIYYRKTRYLLEDVGLRFDAAVVAIDVSDIDDEARYYAFDADERVIDAPGAPVDEAMHRGPDPWQYLLERSLTARTVYALATRLLTAGGWDQPFGARERRARALLGNVRAAWTYDPEAYARIGERGLARAGASMDRLLALLRARGTPLAVVVYPWPAQILARDRGGVHVGFWREWAAARDVAFVDLFPLFLDAGDPWDVLRRDYIPWDSHLTEEGHARVADALLPHVRALLQPPPAAAP